MKNNNILTNFKNHTKKKITILLMILKKKNIKKNMMQFMHLM